MDEHRDVTGGTATGSGPDATIVISRAEDRVDALRDATADLAAVLPTRVEAAVARALGGPDGPSLQRQVADLQRAVGGIADALQAERLGRVGDIELLVDLISADAEATRARLAELERRLVMVAGVVERLVRVVDELTPVVLTVAEKLDRRVRISVHTEPGAVPFSAAKPTGSEPGAGGDTALA
jgi:hypothetical protein